jgi:3-deoxy-D-manno-octulosonic-acid transferase
VAEDAVSANAAHRHPDVDAAMADALELLTLDVARAAMSAAGREFAAHNRGANARTLDLLAEVAQA